jgi:hypothetical protein
MSGAVIHQNDEIHEKSKRNVIRYYEIIEGKTALLKTWEERNPDDIQYINELKIKIRRARVLLSHIRP